MRLYGNIRRCVNYSTI